MGTVVWVKGRNLSCRNRRTGINERAASLRRDTFFPSNGGAEEGAKTDTVDLCFKRVVQTGDVIDHMNYLVVNLYGSIWTYKDL